MFIPFGRPTLRGAGEDVGVPKIINGSVARNPWQFELPRMFCIANVVIQKDKICIWQEFSFKVFFDLFKRWKWMEIIYYHKTLIKYIISRMIFLSLFGGPILTCSTSLFLKGDLQYTAISIYVVGSKLQGYGTRPITDNLIHLKPQHFFHPDGSPSEIFTVWTRHC